MLVWQSLVNCSNHWYGRLWQIVVDISNIGMAAAIPCYQVPPPLLPLSLGGFLAKKHVALAISAIYVT